VPVRGLAVLDGGVWWPSPGTPAAAIAEGSDHRLVWLDLRAVPD
jgi:hypothetical protein